MKPVALIVFVLLLAAAVFVVWTQVDRGPFDRALVSDEAVTWSVAQQVQSGELSGSSLYTRLLAPLTGDVPGRARRLHTAVFGCLFAVGVFVLVRPRAATWTAMTGALVAAFSGPMVFITGSFEPGLVAAVLLVAGLWLLDGRASWWGVALAAVLCGMATHFGPVLGWAMSLLLLAGLTWRPRLLPRWQSAAVFATCWLLSTAMMGRVSGAPDLIPSISGVTVYQGHRSPATGLEPRRSDHDDQRWWSWPDFESHGSREAGRALTSPEVRRFWAKRALIETVTDLPAEIKRTGFKLWATYQALPLPKTVLPSYVADTADGWGLRMAMWLGRCLLPVGLMGLWLGRARLGLPLLAALLSGGLATWVTLVRPEFRILTLLTMGVGLALFLDAVRQRRVRMQTWLATGALVVVLGFLPGWFLPGMTFSSMDRYWAGAAYAADDRGSAAMREFDRSLALDPDNPLPRMAVANMLLTDQVIDEGVAELEIVRERFPTLVRPLVTLGNTYQIRERWAELVVIQEALIDINPHNPEFHNNLGIGFWMAGYLGRAESAFRDALAIDPDYALARRNLTRMQQAGLAANPGTDDGAQRVLTLMREQRWSEAETALAAAYQSADADSIKLGMLEATLFVQTGRVTEAVAKFESLEPALGDNSLFQHNLATAYARSGSLDRALGIWLRLTKNVPGNQVFRGSLAQVQVDLVRVAGDHARAGRQAQAVAAWSALVEAFPTNGDYADSLQAVGERH